MTYQTIEESKKVFMDDLKNHRANIQRAFDLYGKAFCNILNADYEELKENIRIHDLTICENEKEQYGFRIKYYPSIEDDLSKHHVNSAYIYSKSSHYLSNKHHSEHWIHIDNNKLDTKAMEAVYICEMVLDWIATAEREGYIPADEYWANNRNAKCIHEETVDQIDMLMDKYVELRDSKIS